MNLTVTAPFSPQILQHVLVLVNDILHDKENVRFFEEIEADPEKKMSSWEPFMDLLNRPDDFIVNQSCLILAKVRHCLIISFTLYNSSIAVYRSYSTTLGTN